MERLPELTAFANNMTPFLKESNHKGLPFKVTFLKYSTIEKAIHAFENQYNFGKISHVAFEKKRDFRKRKDYLECKIILENYYSN